MKKTMAGLRKTIQLTLTLIALLTIGQVFGQEPNQHMVKLAEHDGAEYNTVMNGYYNYSRYQYIYTKEEIGQSGTINALSFYVDNYYGNVSNGTLSNISIRVGTTTAGNFTTVAYDETLTLVWSGTVDLGGQTGWYSIPLDVPVSYDQTENLIVEIRNEDGNWNNNPLPEFTYTLTTDAQSAPLNMAVKGYSDVNNPPVPYLSDKRGDIIFEFEQEISTPSSIVSIGNSDDFSQSTLLNGYYNYSRVQYLYDDLQIGKTGEITTLSFNLDNYYAGIDQGKIDQITILIGHSDVEEFTGTAQYIEGLQEVWSGVFNSKGNGWYTFDLETGFAYNGTQNLVIEIRSQDGSWSNNPYPEFFYTLNYHPDLTAEFRGIKGYSDTNNPPVPYLSNATVDVNIEFNELEVTSSITNANCNVAGGSGAIDLTVTQGTAPYTYLWLGPNDFTSTSEDLTGLEVGVYTVTVTDAQNTIATFNYEVGNEITWTDLIGVSVDANNNLNKTAVDGWSNAGAASSNKLLPGEDGYVSMEIENLTDEWAVGLSSQNNGENWTTINYAFDKTNNNISIYEDGYYIGICGNYKIGDVIKVAREGDYIKYYLNNLELYSTFTGSSEQLIIDVTIYNQGATLTNLQASFCIPIEIVATSTNVDCMIQNSGTIDVTVSGGIPPYTYSWSNGETTEDLLDLTTGTYSVTVTDSVSDTTQQSITINNNNEITWEGFVLTEVDGNGDLVKTGVDGWSNSDAVSSNRILANQDGSVSMIVDNLLDEWTIGLSSLNEGPGWATIDYAIDKTGNYASIFENGIYIGGFGNHVIGDELRIAREGSNIKYYLNDILLTSTTTDPSLELMVDVTIYNQGGILKNVLTDFCNLPLQVNYTTTNETVSSLGSINLQASGGTFPYYYFWDDGDQSLDRYNLESGIYSVTVVDTLLDTLILTIPVGNQLEWVNVEGLTTNNDELVKTAAAGWGSGIASLNNIVTGEGEVQLTIAETGNEWTYGFRRSTNSQATQYTGLDYGYYIDAANKLYSYENSTLTYLTEVVVGDIVSLEKTSTQVLFKKNGTSLRQAGHNGEDIYKIDFSLSTSGMKLGKLFAIKIPFGPKITAILSHNYCFIPSTGSIDLTIIGGVPPYTYSWSNGATVEDLSGLAPGTYSVTVTDNILQAAGGIYEVGYNVIWTNYTPGATIAGNSITKTDPNGWGNSGGSSTNVLDANTDGWLEFSVPSGNQFSAIGLSQVDQDKNITSIDYGMVFQSVQIFPPPFTFTLKFLAFIEGGAIISSPVLSHYNAGDVFRIERVNSSTTPIINYYKNGGVPLYTTGSSVTPNSLIVDAALNYTNSSFINTIVDFGCAPINSPDIYTKVFKELDGGYYVTNNSKIFIEYTEDYTSSPTANLNYKMFKESDLVNIAGTTQSLIVGNNRREIIYTSSTPPGFYILEIENSKKEKRFLRFKIE